MSRAVLPEGSFRQFTTGSEVLANARRVTRYFRSLRGPGARHEPVGALDPGLAAENSKPVATVVSRAADVEPVVALPSGRRATAADIQQKTAQHFHLRLADLIGPRRTANLTQPRQIAMYLVWLHRPALSLPRIGKLFGDRDHTTVLHAVRKIENLRDSDATLRAHIETLEALLHLDLNDAAHPRAAGARVSGHASRARQSLSPEGAQDHGS